MSRKKYENGAEKQRAYRQRVADKLRQLKGLDGSLSEYERKCVEYLRKHQHECHQKVIRDLIPPEPDEDLRREAAKDFRKATVRQIPYEQAKELISKYEWLAVMTDSAMGTTRWSFGLFFGDYLAAVECYGSTAGTNVTKSVAGAENAHRVCTLVRGARAPWAHPNSGSYLINRACNMMVELGFNLFVAYADGEAREVGKIYQSNSWLFCGSTGTPTLFRLNGKVQDSRAVSQLCRDRRGRKPGEPMKYKMPRAEMKTKLIEQGAEFFKGTPKLRYVGVYGDKRTVRDLKKSIGWEVLPYPKRAVEQSEATPGSNSVAGFDSLPPLQIPREGSTP